MTDVRRLIDNFAAAEHALQQRLFLAPCVRGAQVRVRIDGIVRNFTPEPRRREGWGLFRPKDMVTAVWKKPARQEQIAAYLRLLPAFRLHLATPLRGRTWLACPVNAADARQRLGQCQPMPVYLVEQGAALETIIARWDGAAFWFESADRSADPQLADALRQSLQLRLPAAQLRQKNLTPELRIAYELALGEFARPTPANDRDRLQQALEFAGGKLQDYHDRGEFWLVEWTTQTGEPHHSAIAKRDLSVVSAGICLNEEDNRFDLQSLVGVVEQRPEWM